VASLGGCACWGRSVGPCFEVTVCGKFNLGVIGGVVCQLSSGSRGVEVVQDLPVPCRVRGGLCVVTSWFGDVTRSRFCRKLSAF